MCKERKRPRDRQSLVWVPLWMTVISRDHHPTHSAAYPPDLQPGPPHGQEVGREGGGHVEWGQLCQKASHRCTPLRRLLLCLSVCRTSLSLCSLQLFIERQCLTPTRCKEAPLSRTPYSPEETHTAALCPTVCPHPSAPPLGGRPPDPPSPSKVTESNSLGRFPFADFFTPLLLLSTL